MMALLLKIYFYFTEPGQEITYSFYIRNVGNLTAYIKSYGFKNIDGLSKTVKCTAGEGTSQKLFVDAFCNNGLSYNFSVLNSTTGYGIYHAFEDSTNQKIEINKSGLISLTVKYYDKQRRVDGPVEIEIGEFYINFSTVPNS